MRPRLLACAALASAAAQAPLHAAPLDALQTAFAPSATQRWDIEAGSDHANKALDLLGMRPKRADGSYGPSGIYSGAHLRLGAQITPEWRIEAAYWKRDIQYVSTAADVSTWHLAGQWRMLQAADGQSTLALRASAWGNRAPLLKRNTSITVQGTTFTSAQATNPRDSQIQVDLLASWQLANSLQATVFAGIGHSQVEFDQVRATTGATPACVYDVQFIAGRVVASCELNGTSTRISVPASVYGIDVDKEARYQATTAQVGANAVWQPGNWRLRAGLQFIKLNRGEVDSIVRARGSLAYTSNTIGIAEVGYRFWPGSVLFARAQVMAHQFVGEAPLMYNSLTAAQHRLRYGIATLGLSHSF